MKFSVRSEAENDYAESVLWYLEENQSAQAAERFSAEIEDSYRKIIEAPFQYPARKKDKLRAWPLKHFPFSILYTVEQDEIVVAFLHHHKRNETRKS